MSRRPLPRSALSAALLGLALAAAPAAAQEIPPSPFMQQEIPAEVEALLAEAQETQERLAGIHEQAMAGSEDLQKKQDDLREMVDTAMRSADPEFEANMERMGELEEQAMAAQASQDGERLQVLMTEAQTLAGRLQAAQAQAMDSPDVIREMEAFEEELIAEMTRVDPETPGLLSRLEELAEELEAAGMG